MGSPPLTRGKVITVYTIHPIWGITPAHAGKSTHPACSTVSCRDHPRSRGEKDAAATAPRVCAGSPPLTRGKADRGASGEPARGITPAHAGKSRGFEGFLDAVGDHPRSRGEKFVAVSVISSAIGSPPLTRGKVTANWNQRANKRITPAHAGKSSAGRRRGRADGDHPRSRGEKAVRPPPPLAIVGSPPLTRGKVRGSYCYSPNDRITPAHAGKSWYYNRNG